MARNKGEGKSKEGLKREKGKSDRDAASHENDMREHPEDKGKAARSTTPAGKGRSQ
jgi:hypothetical protein